MSISRFNYTGLRKIDRKDVRVTIEQCDGGTSRFRAELSLAEYKFPSDAFIFIEAYRQTTLMRFPFGIVGAVSHPADTTLSSFDSPDEIKFRVRVTAAGERLGMMLGEAERIRPAGECEDEDDRAPLLPVRASDELGDEIYKVEMVPSPVLLINRRIGDWRAVAASPIFQSLTASAIFRSVLIHLLVIETATDTDDDGSPHVRWLRFAQNLPGVPDYNEETTDPLTWIDDAVLAFARHKSVLTSFMSHWEKAGS